MGGHTWYPGVPLLAGHHVGWIFHRTVHRTVQDLCIMPEFSGTAHCRGGLPTLLQDTFSLQTEGTTPSAPTSPHHFDQAACTMCGSPVLNAHYSRARSVIERAFGMMKSRFWALFSNALEVHHTFVPQVSLQRCLAWRGFTLIITNFKFNLLQ